MTQDARGQLYAGLEAVARAALADMGYPAANVRPQFPNEELLTGLETSGPNPLIVIALGQSALARQPAGLAGRAVTAPITNIYQSTTTQLVPASILSTPVTFIVVGAGVTGKTIVGSMSNALAARIGSVSNIRLPDDMESANNFTLTSPTTYGLTAQLTYTGEREDNSLDERRINRVDLMYTAIHARYTEQTVAVVQNVHLTVLMPSFR